MPHKKLTAFRQYAQHYWSIPDQDWAQVVKRFRRREIKRNAVLLQEGKTCRHLWFVESGLLRFHLNKDGADVTKFFTIAPYCFTSQTSFNRRIPAKESISAIEDSVLWETTFAENEELLELKSWNTFARKVAQEVQYYTEHILEALQT